MAVRPKNPGIFALSVTYTVKGHVCSAKMTVTVREAVASGRPATMPQVRSPTAEVASPRPTSEAVLGHLANIVGSMADGAKVHAQLLNQLGSTYADYVHSARALLTGQPVSIPTVSSGVTDAPIVADRPGAVAAINALGANTASMMDALAEIGSNAAKELSSVQKKEEEEKKNPGPGTTPGGGTTTGGGGGGTPTPADPGDGSSTPGPTDGSGSTPSAPTPTPRTPQPVQPKKEDSPATPKRPVPPTVTVKKKKVRRCFRFHLTNTGTSGISDLHFQQDGLVPSSTGGPTGWKNLRITNDGGFAWEAKSPKDCVKPGKDSEYFEFCLEDALFGGDVFITHPDPKKNAPQKLSPDDIRANGGPVGVNKDGTLALPVMKDGTTYITEFDVKINGDPSSVKIQMSGGKGIPEITGGNGVLGGTADPNVAEITPKSGSSFSDGDHVTITTESKSANTTLKGL
jgi:hypothetical protein